MKYLNKNNLNKIGILFLTSGLLVLNNNLIVNAKVMSRSLDELVNPKAWDIEDGNTVYFGRYKGVITKFRVLDLNSKGLLIDSDKGLYVEPYNKILTDVNWADSELLESLNGFDYLLAKDTFSVSELNIINTVNLNSKSLYSLNRKDGTSLSFIDDSSTSKIFALSASEADMYYKSDIDRIKDTQGIYWWLRSGTGKSKEAAYINNGGVTGYLEVNQMLASTSPAMYLDIEMVKYAWPYSQKRETLGGYIGNDSAEIVDWTLCIEGGNGFGMSYLEGDASEISVRIDSFGLQDEGVEYDRLSAILLDENGDVLSYGLVKYAWGINKGDTITVSLDDDIRDQVMGIEFFMEDVGTYGAVASNSQVFDISNRFHGTESEDVAEEDVVVEQLSPEVDMDEVKVEENEKEVISFDMSSGSGSQVVPPDKLLLTDYVPGTWYEYVTQDGVEYSYTYIDGDIVYQDDVIVNGVSDVDGSSCVGHHYRFTAMLSLLGLQRWWWKRKLARLEL